MADNRRDPAKPVVSQQARPARGLRLGRVKGIEIFLDPSLAVIFALVVSLLALSAFPDWHPEWSAATRWLTAGAAGVLFFASILLHELAHSVVAQRFGMELPRITLFMFGGAAEIREEPESPRAELLMALAGPATSLALGVLLTWLAASFAEPGFQALWADDPENAMASLSPLATLLLWLGPINVLLGLFNLVPGFPLDGGRALRALVWWFTGDLHRATRFASDAGRLFGWMLVLFGVLQAFQGYVLQGIWLVLIGWFLAGSAASSYRRLVLHDILEGVTVRNLMRKRFETITTNLPLSDFIDGRLLQSLQVLWPVVEEGDSLVGLVTLREVLAVPNHDRANVRVGQVMRTDLGAFSLAPETDAVEAMQALQTRDVPLAVVDRGRIVGLLSQEDIAKWLVFHRVSKSV